jgi:3-deoxy-D-manno-octulosonate 8-phosphate phosphatase (KDO 8-P phosphatase)
MASDKKPTIKNFILDVDGVMTDGRFYYTAEGKFMKSFGPDDSDALSLLRNYVNILFVSGDKKGFEISRKRIEIDMKYPLHSVSTFERVQWMLDAGYHLEETVYMGDGIFDAMVFDRVAYGIAPANGFQFTKDTADFVTPSTGGNSAVAEACLHIMETFFEPVDLLNIADKVTGGEWVK